MEWITDVLPRQTVPRSVKSIGAELYFTPSLSARLATNGQKTAEACSWEAITEKTPEFLPEALIQDYAIRHPIQRREASPVESRN